MVCNAYRISCHYSIWIFSQFPTNLSLLFFRSGPCPSLYKLNKLKPWQPIIELSTDCWSMCLAYATRPGQAIIRINQYFWQVDGPHCRLVNLFLQLLLIMHRSAFLKKVALSNVYIIWLTILNRSSCLLWHHQIIVSTLISYIPHGSHD